MNSAQHCPRCQAPLPADGPQGLCPQCLLQVGLESNTQPSDANSDVDSANLPTTSFAGGLPAAPSKPKSRAELPRVGEQFGSFRLIRKLGEGGMGAVFEADDLESGRRVAVKLLAHSLDSETTRNRFFREGRLAASINHPNSVYVFGTSEVDGTPIISMEHIAGGTLADRVKENGPLPVTEAVDAILQIIDGLEAAATAGVLHRDVKPSNCFVDTDGVVKVGDFGLSISTAVRGDSHLTQPGSFLGTPAFSSPEQLRGDELDIRSDIYAVGVTLFYLLTGNTPFEADNLVKLLATVLEQPAPSPTKFRENIPHGLAVAVQRCLAKQPADRFKSYADLRRAIAPYNSAAPSPATLALRFVAGCADMFLWTLFVSAVQLAWFGSFLAMADPQRLHSRQLFPLMAISMALYVLYYAVPEGLWGASLGKAICRLRVVDRHRNRIGVGKALIRAAIFVTFPNLIIWAYWLFRGEFPFNPEAMASFGSGQWWMAIAVSYSFYVMLALLFATARRGNGYCGLHDLAVGARVIRRRSGLDTRPILHTKDESLPDLEDQQTIGPYYVLDSLGSTEFGQWLLGYDQRLLRRVWIHQVPAGAPAIDSRRRNIGRVGRVRWINGRREESSCWDAYEALSGKALVTLLDQPQSWESIRYWLTDLAQELTAATNEGTMPARLSLDRVWITADGRAKLLDFPAPGLATFDGIGATKPAKNTAIPYTHEFLLRVANASLLGSNNIDQVPADRPAGMPMPIDAREVLQQLAAGGELSPIATQLMRLARKPATVTRARRAAMLAAIAAAPLFFATFIMVSMSIMAASMRQDPEMYDLRNCLLYMDFELARRQAAATTPEDIKWAAEEREACEIYIAGRFREAIGDRQRWNSLLGLMIPAGQRMTAERIIAERPQPSPEELQKATQRVEKKMETFGPSADLFGRVSPVAIGGLQFVTMWIMFVAVPGLIAAVAFRRGLIMTMFGVDCVTRNGQPASRPRMLWRAILFNTPVVAAPIAFAFLYPLVRQVTPTLIAVAVGLLTIMLTSLLLPRRGFMDYLAGVYAVAR